MPPAKRPDLLPTPEARDEYIELLKQEPWLAGILSELERPKFQLDRSIGKEIQEIAHDHSAAYLNGRPRIPVVRGKTDLIALQEENSKCLADRDRVTEIIVSYLAVRHALDALWEAAEERLTAYPAYKACPNEHSRKLFVLSVLRPIHEKRTYVHQVLEMAEVVQQALTHTHFTIKQQAEMGIAVLGMKTA